MATEHQEFVARFMADYFAECEEHLVEVRASLLSLERGLDTGRLPAALLDDVFRNFHSLKGISAIAEMRDGERLAHELESYLRALRAGDAALSADGLDALVDGTTAFERILQAKQAGREWPPIDPVLERLARVTQTGAAAPASRQAVSPTGPAPAGGQRWTVTFTPSPELIARGIKVDTIRERLGSIGEVESAAPRVLDGGRIAFDFVVATDDEETLHAWRSDGVTCEPAQPAGTPADQAREPGAEEDRSGGPASFVRVDLARLDDLMRHVGDMVVTRSRLEDVLQRVEPVLPAAEWRLLADHSDRLDRQLRSVREGLMRVRMVPVAEIFRRMPFVVRDLVRQTGKDAEVAVSGQDTEIDKLLVERMADPVLHLVRNAVSHGLERPEERSAAGKPPRGTVTLSAVAVGGSAIIEVGDDGRGLDRHAVAARARHLGLWEADVVPDARQLLDAICTPGFSTRDEADRVSGRGIGMTVVQRTVRELGGTIDLETEPGVGTTFRITLPLTLAIADALLVTVGTQTFAVPQSAIREVIEVDAGAITRIEGNELVVHRGGTLPLVRLSRLFGVTTAPRSRLHALVVGAGTAAFGVLVDRIIGQREIVVKTVTDPLIRVGGVTGVTELGDGRVVLILDVPWMGAPLRGRGAAVRPGTQENPT